MTRVSALVESPVDSNGLGSSETGSDPAVFGVPDDESAVRVDGMRKRAADGVPGTEGRL